MSAVKIQEFGNRLDVIFVTTSLYGLVYFWITGHPRERFWMTFILFRLLTIWKRALNLTFLTFMAVRPLMNMIVLIFTLFFMFGIIGVTFFKDGMTNASEDGYFEDKPAWATYANFDNLSNAFLFLTNVFHGECLHEIMENTRISWAINGVNKEDHAEDMKDAISDVAESQMTGVWFIILFYFIMSTLFVNLIFGLLFSTFDQLSEILQDDSGGRINQEMVDSLQYKEIDDEVPVIPTDEMKI